MKVQSFQVFLKQDGQFCCFVFNGDELQSTDIPLIILSFKPFFQGYRSSYQPMLQFYEILSYFHTDQIILQISSKTEIDIFSKGHHQINFYLLWKILSSVKCLF